MARKQDEFKNNVAVMAVVVGALVIVFTVFHYFRFSAQLLRGNTYRIFDWGAARNNLVGSAAALAVWFVLLVGLVASAAPPNWVVWLLFIASLPILNWAGMAQALSFVGVVVNLDEGRLYIPPTTAQLTPEKFLRVYPVIVRLTTPAWISLSSIEGMNRQAGRRLFLHTKHGSVDLNFSDKLKRDECIHAIRVAAGLAPEPELEADYEYQ